MQKDEASYRAHNRLSFIQREIQLNLQAQRRVISQLEDLLFCPDNPQRASWSKNRLLQAEAGEGSQMDAHGRFTNVGGDSLANALLNANANLLVLLASYNSLVTAYAEEHLTKEDRRP